MWGPRPQRAAVDALEGAVASNVGSADSPATEAFRETAGGYEPIIAPCGCFAVIGDDDSIDRLRDLVRAGMGQMEASRAIWGVRT